MPYGDCTGPNGVGPRTGRGLGRASGNNEGGWIFNRGAGRGYGRGLGLGMGRRGRAGRGRGFGRGYGRAFFGINSYQTTDTKQQLEEDLNYIDEQIKALETEKDAITKRLNEE